MVEHVILLSIPGLRKKDVQSMPRLTALMKDGDRATMAPSFPALTWPVHANMLTGRLPAEHGVVGNGYFDRDRRACVMWTLGNAFVQAPQIWDVLHQRNTGLTSAAWFPMLARDCRADYVCMPAPVHNPDGSETPWCYSRPDSLYGILLEELGPFPLERFWGPLAGIESTNWIVDSAVIVGRRHRPNFFFIYLPNLDYAPQRNGPDSPEAKAALHELDAAIGRLADGLGEALKGKQVLWLAASEYTISPVDHVVYPNRILREDGFLKTRTVDGRELIDFEASYAWVLADHQIGHVYVRDADPDTMREVVRVFRNTKGVADVLAGAGRQPHHVDHPRAGEVILTAEPHSWFAYYWWNEDRMAPAFAATVDIHRKPGYDPVELFFDPATRSIPLDATRVRGSHGAPVASQSQEGVILASRPTVLPGRTTRDVDVFSVVLRKLGIDVD